MLTMTKNLFLLFPLIPFVCICISQCGKAIDGNYTAQRVTISPNNIQQTFKDTYDNIYSERNQLKTPPSRHAVKEILVSVTRGPPPDKKLHQQIYHLSSSSDDETQKNKRLVRANVS